MKTRYVIKGINKEQTIQSIVAIHVNGEGRISKVEDKWNGKLPDGAIANVGRFRLFAYSLGQSGDVIKSYIHNHKICANSYA